MGLFDTIFVKKGADGLPDSFSSLYKATECNQKGYDVHYGFRCLEKMYEIGKKAIQEGKMSTGQFVGSIKGDHYFPRIEDLAEVYKTGEYWYDNNDEGRRYFIKVCEPDMAKHYECYASMAIAAKKLTDGFQKEYELKETTMREVPNYFLQAGLGYSKGYLKSHSASIKTKELAASYLDTAFKLCCRGYGLTPEYITNHHITEKPNGVAFRALEELVTIPDYLASYRSLNDYIKMAQEYKIGLPEKLLQKIKELD